MSNPAMSACNKCNAMYPSAPSGTVHKCGQCSGGVCLPVTPRPTEYGSIHPDGSRSGGQPVGTNARDEAGEVWKDADQAYGAAEDAAKGLSSAEVLDAASAAATAIISAAITAAEQRGAERQWQPISTAPKDGTWILLRGRNGANHPMIPVVVRWSRGLHWAGDFTWRDSGSDRNMQFLVDDVPLGSSADWCRLPANAIETGAHDG